MSRILFLCAFLLFDRTAFAKCSEAEAINAVRAATTKYCSRYRGCDFKARHVSSDADREWSVITSLIHSIENGNPRFMPEGVVFVSVSESCKATFVRSHGGEEPIEEWQRSLLGGASKK